MKRNKCSDTKPMTAAEFARQQHSNPEFAARQAEFEAMRQEAIRQRRLAVLPVVKELVQAGFAVESLDELRQSGRTYQDAVPILLRWLPRIANLDVKESIVRTLSVPWAKPMASRPLVAEFQSAAVNAASPLKWAIGNALEVVADDSVFDEIAALVRDKRHGAARQMLAAALSKMKDPRTVDLLIELLNDEEIAGHALMALGRLSAQKAAPQIRRLLNHPKSWVRHEAGKALAKLSIEV